MDTAQTTLQCRFFTGAEWMRVPEVVLKCVGFVGEVAGVDSVTGEPYGDLHGTGFFVAVPPFDPRLRRTSMRFVYFVTAKHVVAPLVKRNATVYFRVNKRGGGTTVIRGIQGTEWYMHPSDPTADVAVIPIRYQDEVDIRAVEYDDLVTSEHLKRLAIGIGDETFITGLFQPPGGMDHDIPIVRHGNVAMMPDTQIQTSYGYADVYLLEARSIGGISGSPVFVRPTLNLPLPAGSGATNMYAFGPGHPLLGVAHGHWDVNEDELNCPTINHDKQRGVNLGVAIVVPAYKIKETLDRPELIGVRAMIEKQMKARANSTMDSAKQDAPPEVKEFTQDDFEAALKKVSRKVEEQ